MTDPRTRRDVRRILLMAVFVGVAVAAAACGRATPPPLDHASDSAEALARRILVAIAENDRQALDALALSEREFRDRVWPELPASRPERNLPLEYVWGDLRQKSTGYLRAMLAQHGGRRYELVRVEYLGDVTPYRSFEVARRAQLHVRDDHGEPQIVRLFGSVLRSSSGYKVFSYVVD
jgi:hypothetical protein